MSNIFKRTYMVLRYKSIFVEVVEHQLLAGQLPFYNIEQGSYKEKIFILHEEFG